MAGVIAIGETVFDIIFKAGQPVAARPGGSMLNTAVSLGRSGVKVEMVTEMGADAVGKLVLEFLSANGVSSSAVSPLPGFQTPVSLAFLDENGDAHYSFYKQEPVLTRKLNGPQVAEGDIVLFGSFYSLHPGRRPALIKYLREAKAKGALIFYDPNIRKNHLHELASRRKFIDENISLADILRGSDEDFKHLFDTEDDRLILEKVKGSGCNTLMITKGPKGAFCYAENAEIHFPAKPVRVLSTIGAGDAFNAGIIFGLIRQNISAGALVNINREKWMELAGYGINFAAEVCGSFDNYIATPSVT